MEDERKIKCLYSSRDLVPGGCAYPNSGKIVGGTEKQSVQQIGMNHVQRDIPVGKCRYLDMASVDTSVDIASIDKMQQ